ncbi:hypothetical protein ACFLQ1_01985 [Candidatus Auribacterota bacterium]
MKKVIVFFVVTFFAVGSLYASTTTDVTAKVTKSATEAAEKVTEAKEGGTVLFASKNGKKYHLEACTAGVKAIKEENLIKFSSKEEAEKQGYGPCKKCIAVE